MNKITNIQLDEKSLRDFSFQLIICSSGYEKRASHLVEKYSDVIQAIPRRICLCFQDHIELARQYNDNVFKNADFEFILENGDSITNLQTILSSITLIQDTPCNIIVDYSSMTRVWYAEIVRYFRDIQLTKEVNIFFSYSFAQFVPSPTTWTVNQHAGPINGFSFLSIPNRPTALILGLGYEKDKAFGLKEYLDAEPYVFCSDSSFEPEYSNGVEFSNEKLLSQIEPSHIFKYPMNDLKFTEHLLTTLCNDLARKYRIILAPCGPKPFTLLCFLVSAKYMDDFIDVWRISAGSAGTPKDRKARGEILVSKVSFRE